jgi:3-hydroxyisobutyrate dehydrogenase
MNIAFLGTGIMGAPMAANLMARGFALQVYNRTTAKTAALVEKGAKAFGTPAEAVKGAAVVITMLGLPSDVEEVYFGADGVIANAEPGATLIDMTTSSPMLAQRIAEAASKRGLSALDAPVSGGEIGAINAKLAIMVGGDAEVFERARPVFEAMGTNINHLGPAGSGQHCKLVNQTVIAGTMLGVAEGLAYAEKVGLQPQQVLAAIGTGAAGSFLLNNLGPKMVARDFAPGFMIEHIAKDLRLAMEEANRLGLTLGGLGLALDYYRMLRDSGHAKEGTQALIRNYLG